MALHFTNSTFSENMRINQKEKMREKERGKLVQLSFSLETRA